MDNIEFKNRYSIANKRLKKGLSVDYINNAAEKLDPSKMQSKILEEVFSELEEMDPRQVDISIGNIRRLYFGRYRSQLSLKTVQGIKKPCTHNYCNGQGLVVTIKMTEYGYKADYGWRCQCMLGQNMDQRIPQWKPEYMKSLGHMLQADNVYTEKKHSDDLKEDKANEDRKKDIQLKLDDVTKNMSVEADI